MTLALFQKPPVTPSVNSGNSSTVIPVVPFRTFDGGSAKGVSNPPWDGGEASSMPNPRVHDGGCA